MYPKLSFNPFIPSSLHPSSNQSFQNSSIHLSMFRPFCHSSVLLSIDQSIDSLSKIRLTHPIIIPFIRPFVQPSIHPFILLSKYLPNHFCLCQFVDHPSIHPEVLFTAADEANVYLRARYVTWWKYWLHSPCWQKTQPSCFYVLGLSVIVSVPTFVCVSVPFS